jgi:hypothetical protein
VATFLLNTGHHLTVFLSLSLSHFFILLLGHLIYISSVIT